MEKLMQILTEACPGVEFDGQTALIDDGILGSLDIVTIVSALMHAYDVTITVDDLVPENFNSAQALWEMIQRLDEA